MVFVTIINVSLFYNGYLTLMSILSVFKRPMCLSVLRLMRGFLRMVFLPLLPLVQFTLVELLFCTVLAFVLLVLSLISPVVLCLLIFILVTALFG